MARATASAVRAHRHGWLAVLGVALLSAAVPAEPSEWVVAELPGGDVRSLAIHPGDPDHLLAGTASGQVFRSTDGGASWHLPGPRLPFRGWVVSDLVFDPRQPSVVWAALRGAWGQDGLVAQSVDGGVSWRSRSSGMPGRQVYAMALTPDVVYAATRLGGWGTRDGGESWQHLTAAHPEIRKVTSLLIDPRDPERVFAGTWRRAYRSDDGGRSWRGVFEGMVLDSEVFSLHAVPGSDGEMWASTCGWVYRSTNRGASWRRFQNGLAERRTPSFQVLADGSKLAGTVAGVYRSDDDGASWHLVTPDDLVALAIEHHPDQPLRVFVATEGAGVWRSDDGGRSFHSSSRGLNAARIAALAAKDGEVIAAVRHSGPASGLYSSFDGGKSYPIGPVRLPTITALSASGAAVFAATEAGLFERRGLQRQPGACQNQCGPVRPATPGGEVRAARVRAWRGGIGRRRRRDHLDLERLGRTVSPHRGWTDRFGYAAEAGSPTGGRASDDGCRGAMDAARGQRCLAGAGPTGDLSSNR